MHTIIRPLEIRILLEWNPLRSRILIHAVRILAMRIPGSRHSEAFLCPREFQFRPSTVRVGLGHTPELRGSYFANWAYCYIAACCAMIVAQQRSDQMRCYVLRAFVSCWQTCVSYTAMLSCVALRYAVTFTLQYGNICLCMRLCLRLRLCMGRVGAQRIVPYPAVPYHVVYTQLYTAHYIMSTAHGGLHTA